MTSTSALTLVGWDDVKGRPIYSKNPAALSSSKPLKAKKNKAPIKKKKCSIVKTKIKTSDALKSQRRSIPTVQVAVSSLVAKSDAIIGDIDLSSLDRGAHVVTSKKGKRSNKTSRKVSFSPDNNRTDNDTHGSPNNNKPLVAPNRRSWDRKRKGYGSKKFSHTKYISPVLVVDGWGTMEEDSSSSHYDNNESSLTKETSQDETESLKSNEVDGTEEEEEEAAEAILSVVNDDDDLPSYNDDDVTSSSFSPTKTMADCIPEVIDVETFTRDSHSPDKPHALNPAIDSINNTPSTKTAEESSYKLRSGCTHDFVDIDIPNLDEPNPAPAAANDDNMIQKSRVKKRSYGCHEKPVWVASSKQDKSATAQPVNAIGWDEALCRPIFHVQPKKKKKKVDDENDELDELSICEEEEEELSAENKRTHKRRTYSSRFKRTSLTKAIEQMSVTSPKNTDDHSDISSAHDVEEGEEDDGEIGARNANVVNDDDVDSNAIIDFDVESEEIAHDNDNNATHIQPTESSSLEAARAFFRYLDSNHHLVFDQNVASPRISSEIIRTKRSRIEHTEKLRAEYSDYCNYLAETGVAPISITEFASNWNKFVGKGSIRDGLLDED